MFDSFYQQGPRFFSGRTAPQQSLALPKVILDVLAKPLSWFQEDALRKNPDEPMLTQVGFILDKSGSMETGKSITVEGFNTQLARVLEGAASVGETLMTFTQFSDTVSVAYSGVPVEKIEPLTMLTYRPNGYTALYDGIGDTLASLLSQPRTSSPSCATLITIFTDGEENASVRYSAAVVRDLIQRLEATGRWTFALVGPKTGVKSLAALLAVADSNITGFEPASLESRSLVMGAMAKASSSYMASRAQGASQVRGLYHDDLTK